MSPSGTAAALITAAGQSSRMGGGIKKEYRPLEGTPIITRIYRIFAGTGLFGPIVITCPGGDETAVRELLDLPSEENCVLIIPGGKSRQESVYAGLAALKESRPDWVLIHDGSRPWISGSLIERVLDIVKMKGACIPVVPPVDTLGILDGEGNVDAYLDRSRVFQVQTPQGFHFQALLKAHTTASSDGQAYTDDSEIYRRYCGPVGTVVGDPVNRKITYPQDI